jgi:hypothetical protein
MRILEVITESGTWQKKSGKNKNGGLNKKGVASYRREHPGSHLQTAVTTKPSKLKKGSKASKRRASFCARMKGMKKHRTGSKTAHDPNSRINKSLRKWHCESIEEMAQLIKYAEQVILQEKKTLKNSNPCWKGYHPVGTKKKGGRTVPNCVPTEESIGNQYNHGSGTIERVQDMPKFMEQGSEPHLLGKLEKTGQVVRIIKRVKHVQFSEHPDWLLIDKDLTEKGKEFKWIPGNTKFTWVKEFSREEIENENIGMSVGMAPALQPWGSTPIGNYPVKGQGQ